MYEKLLGCRLDRALSFKTCPPSPPYLRHMFLIYCYSLVQVWQSDFVIPLQKGDNANYITKALFMKHQDIEIF